MYTFLTSLCNAKCTHFVRKRENITQRKYCDDLKRKHKLQQSIWCEKFISSKFNWKILLFRVCARPAWFIIKKKYAGTFFSVKVEKTTEASSYGASSTSMLCLLLQKHTYTQWALTWDSQHTITRSCLRTTHYEPTQECTFSDTRPHSQRTEALFSQCSYTDMTSAGVLLLPSAGRSSTYKCTALP